MGEVQVPARAYYSAQTQRAVENFPISGQPLPPRLVRALGLVKIAAAVANRDLGKLKPELAEPIIRAAREVAVGVPRHQRPRPGRRRQRGRLRQRVAVASWVNAVGWPRASVLDVWLPAAS